MFRDASRIQRESAVLSASLTGRIEVLYVGQSFIPYAAHRWRGARHVARDAQAGVRLPPRPETCDGPGLGVMKTAPSAFHTFLIAPVLRLMDKMSGRHVPKKKANLGR